MLNDASCLRFLVKPCLWVLARKWEDLWGLGRRLIEPII